MKHVSFNINEYVLVKITPEAEMARSIRIKSECGITVQPLKRDENGYTKMQLWEVMQDFGPQISIGFNPPIETTILIEFNALRPSDK